MSNGIYTTQSNGSKTVVYRNEGVRTYLDELNRAIERQTTKMSNATDPDVLAANEKYLYALTQESAALEAELGKPRASTAKGVEIVEWDQPATCGFIIYANAEFAFWPNLVNSAYVTSSIDPIGSGPQFSSPPGPTRTYRHVRSEVDDPSLSAPAVEVATTRTNASTLSVTATHTNFWGDACVLTSTRTLRERRCVQWHRTGSGGEHPKLQRTVAIAWTPDHSAWSDPTSRSERRPE